jgi:hypothetical protein
MRLIDDGKQTFWSLKSFDWEGPTVETPWGIAAYTKDDTPKEMATGRVGGWFGVANGRTWSQVSPIAVEADPANVSFNINAEDIVEVDQAFGGGYVGYGRHDFLFRNDNIVCPFGVVFQRRISNEEAKDAGKDVNLAKVSWYEEYRG